MSLLSQVFTLTLRFGRRALGQRANHLLSACIIICTCVAASLSFFSNSVQTALDKDISQFLGAPLVVRADKPVTEGLTIPQGVNEPVLTAAFTTGAIADNAYQSVALKGIARGYPLQGELLIVVDGREMAATGQQLDINSAWLDQRALDDLKVSTGQKIQIGSAWFTVVGEILHEPDRLTQLQHSLPRVMVSLAGLAQTGVSVDNDRGSYSALFDGESAALMVFRDQLPNLIAHPHEVLTPGSGKHPFSRISVRAERMLNVVLVLMLLMCGGAAATLANYTVRQYTVPATVLRCMGVNRHAVTLALCIQLSVLAVLMSLIGCFLAWLIQPLLISLMQPHMTLEVVSVNAADLLLPLGIGLLTVLAFVVPKLQQLGSVSVVAVLRGQFEESRRFYITALIAALLITLILWVNSDNNQLTLMMVGAVVSLVILSLAFGWALSKLSAQGHRLCRGPIKVAVRSIGRSPKRHIATLVSVSIAMMAVLMTVTLRGSFLDVLQVQMLETDGNYIYTGLPADQKDEFASSLQSAGAQLKGMYPTVSAKLVSINGNAVDQHLQKQSDTREEIRSKVRLSWAQNMPDNNVMLDGVWPQIGSNEVSIESEVMTDLGLNLGDELGFQIGTELLKSRISSRREYKGGSSRVMFWFMFAPDTLARFEQKMMGGILLHKNQHTALSMLSSSFPQTRVTDLERQISGVRSIMVVLTRLMNTTLVLLMGGAFMLIVASSFVSASNRRVQVSLMRALGLQSRHCYAMNMIEQITIGLVACAVGVLGVQLIGGAMFNNLFAMSYELDWPRVMSLTLLVCTAFAVLGWVFAFRSLQQPVRITLES